MPVSALALTLAAALVHAGWNLLLSGADDTRSATAVASVAGAVLCAPVAALTWHMQPAAVPFMAASATLEALYLMLLATGYDRAEMSFVYPIARGSAPVFVLLISVLALKAGVAPLTAVGVLVVAGGVALVHGMRSTGRLPDLALALAVGACISGYTLVDKHGIVHASATAYIEVVFSATAAMYTAAALRSRGVPALRRAVSGRAVVAGAGFFGAYGLVLVALRLAPAPSVAAVRESSVVIGTAILALSGRERITPARFAGAVVVVIGIALVSLG